MAEFVPYSTVDIEDVHHRVGGLRGFVLDTLVAYLDAAEWLAPETDDGEVPDLYGFPWHPDTVRDARRDVIAFLRSVDQSDLDAYGWDGSQMGHDLFLTRNGHGAGFWDRGLGDLGDRLSAAARAMGSGHEMVWVDGDYVRAA